MEIKRTCEIFLGNDDVAEIIKNYVDKLADEQGFIITGSDRNNPFPDIKFYGEQK